MCECERFNRETQEELKKLRRSIENLMSSTQSGLAALQQADTDLAAAITENTAATQQAVTEIQTLISEAGEDATVGSIAADLEAKLATIKSNSAALAGAVPAPPAATTPTPAPAA